MQHAVADKNEIATTTGISNPVRVAQIGKANQTGTDKDLTIFLYFMLRLFDGLNTIIPFFTSLSTSPHSDVYRVRTFVTAMHTVVSVPYCYWLFHCNSRLYVKVDVTALDTCLAFDLTTIVAND